MYCVQTSQRALQQVVKLAAMAKQVAKNVEHHRSELTQPNYLTWLTTKTSTSPEPKLHEINLVTNTNATPIELLCF